MTDITAVKILGLDTNGYQTINANYAFPTAGYFVLMKQRGGTVTVNGVAMTQIGNLGGTNGVYLYGLGVSTGVQNITCSISTYSIHAILFGNTRGHLQVTTSLNRNPPITPQKGDAVGQFIWCANGEASTRNAHYTAPTEFTELSDSGAIGSGSDWWHGGASSFKTNVGVAPLTLTWVTGEAADDFYSFNIELVKSMSGDNQVIWWN